jgi:hypothetical protein
MDKKILDFKEVLKQDLTNYIEKKGNLSYVSWAFAWQEFVKIYPNATYKIKKDDNNKCFFGDENIGYMVYTSVKVNDLEREMWLPVMDNKNKTMKLKSYQYKTKWGNETVEAVTMFDINKTIMRCLTKNLAMFGLGLYVYAGEDLPAESQDENQDKNQITAKMLIDLAKKKNIDPDYIFKKYKKETGKSILDLKYITQEKKQEYYKLLEAK